MPDGILYINLEYRLDRKASILLTIQKVGLNMQKVQRIDAILNKLCGHIGCGESHIKALETAIQYNWKDVLILEDDFIFTQPADIVSKIFVDLEPLKWDVVLLSGGHKELEPTDHKFLKKVINCTTAAGYIVRRHYYETLIQNFQESIKLTKKELDEHIIKCKIAKQPITKLINCTAIDQHWFSLQAKDTWFLCDPILGSQAGGYSDNNCTIEHQNNRIYKKNPININRKIYFTTRVNSRFKEI